MAYTILSVLLLPPLTFALWNLQCLLRNYRAAKSMDIPIVIILASGDNPVWILLSTPVLLVLRFLFGEIDIVKYGKPGWESKNKYKMHEELGDVVIHVSPGHNWLYVCNAEAVNEIFKRKEDFDRPPDLLGMYFCYVEDNEISLTSESSGARCFWSQHIYSKSFDFILLC